MTTYAINQAVLDLSAIKTAQVQQLATILLKHGSTTHDSESIAKLLQDNELKTRQDPYLIFKYYQRELVNLGILTVNKAKSAVKIARDTFIDGLGI